MVTPPRPGFPAFQFINIATPEEAPSRSRLQKIRSHAARNSRPQRRKALECRARSNQDGLANGHQALTTGNHPRISHNMSAARIDPFDTFVRKVSRFEWFLIDHFIQHVVAYSTVCIPFISRQEEEDFLELMSTWWTKTAATDTGILGALLLTACRNLSIYHHSESYTALALKYGGECIESLKLALENEGTVPSEITIAKAFALAADATQGGDVKAAKVHLEGLAKLITMRGGVEKLPDDRGPGTILTWFLKGPSMKNALVTTTCMNLMVSAQEREQTEVGMEGG